MIGSVDPWKSENRHECVFEDLVIDAKSKKLILWAHLSSDCVIGLLFSVILKLFDTDIVSETRKPCRFAHFPINALWIIEFNSNPPWKSSYS